MLIGSFSRANWYACWSGTQYSTGCNYCILQEVQASRKKYVACEWKLFLFKNPGYCSNFRVFSKPGIRQVLERGHLHPLVTRTKSQLRLLSWTQIDRIHCTLISHKNHQKLTIFQRKKYTYLGVDHNNTITRRALLGKAPQISKHMRDYGLLLRDLNEIHQPLWPISHFCSLISC